MVLIRFWQHTQFPEPVYSQEGRHQSPTRNTVWSFRGQWGSCPLSQLLWGSEAENTRSHHRWWFLFVAAQWLWSGVRGAMARETGTDNMGFCQSLYDLQHGGQHLQFKGWSKKRGWESYQTGASTRRFYTSALTCYKLLQGKIHYWSWSRTFYPHMRLSSMNPVVYL